MYIPIKLHLIKVKAKDKSCVIIA